jgi:capsular exopolysaccharide synthesis family protein
MTNTTEDNVELSDYFTMLKKNWLIALIIFLVIMGAAILYTVRSPKIYLARSAVMVSTQDQTAYLLGSTFANAPRTDIQTQRAIVLSSSVLNPVYSQPEEASFKITVNAIKDSNVLEILVESQGPYTAMRVANKVAESYVNYTRESKKQEALGVNAFIEEQIAQYRTELDVLNMQILAYKNNKNLSVSEQVKYQSLQQAQAAKEKLYNYLLSRAEEVSIVAKETGGSVKIIEYAQPSMNPVKPNVLLNLALGFILAIICSMGMVFAKESLRKTFKDITAAEEAFNSTIMGVIPRIKRGECTYEGKADFTDQVSEFAKNPVRSVRKALSSKKVEKREYYMVDHNSEGPFAESIRMLRTNIMFYIKEKNIKLISINSPQKNDGKTTIAINLAMEIAREGKKVLLVDANLRNPVLNRVFNIKEDEEEGLSEVIRSEAKLDKAIKKTSHKNLYLLSAGKHNHVPGHLISPEKLKEVFKQLKASDFDVVLFDNTSLKYSESVSVSASSQGVLFIIAHDKTNKDLALKSKATLAKVNAHVIGLVINFYK